MEALYVRPVGSAMEEGEEPERRVGGGGGGGWEEEGTEASSTTEEDTDEEEEEAEPPAAAVRRKVSFADAFGLNLVSVKEYDKVEAAEAEVNRPVEREAANPLEDFHMCCQFTCPASSEELDQRLRDQMLELESIELMPGTRTLRGIVRVVNLCYSKRVCARVSLDCWASHFDLEAEYVPGSSDRQTDRFSFKYTFPPPLDRGGTRVDFCLRYETDRGTFWANNRDMNYVLFCHQKGQSKEPGPQGSEEGCGGGGYRGKRSCLKANRRGSAEEVKSRESFNTATLCAETQSPHKTEETDRQTADGTFQSLLRHEGYRHLVEGVRASHRGARSPRAFDDSTRGRKAAKAHDQKVMPWCGSASNRYGRQKKPDEALQVLTYHQIPLLRLDWKTDTAQGREGNDLDEEAPSVSDLWKRFLDSSDSGGGKEISVCDAWKEFLNGPSCRDLAGVPESEWLQTAASVSPSKPGFSRNGPALSGLVPDEQERQLQAVRAQRSQTNATDITGESGPEGAAPNSPVDSSPEHHELQGEGRRGGDDGDDDGVEPEEAEEIEVEVRGGVQEVEDDTLAFRETMRRGTEEEDKGEAKVENNAFGAKASDGRSCKEEFGKRLSESEIDERAMHWQEVNPEPTREGNDTASKDRKLEEGSSESEELWRCHEEKEEEVEEDVLVPDQTEGNGIKVERQEMTSSCQSTHGEEIKVLESDTLPAHRRSQRLAEWRLESSQEVMKGRAEGRDVITQEEEGEERMMIEGVEEDGRGRGVEDSRGESEERACERKEAEKPPGAGCRTMVERAGKSRAEEALVERFVEDFIRGVWGEVFGRREQAGCSIPGRRGSRTLSPSDPHLRILREDVEPIKSSAAASSMESAQTISSPPENPPIRKPSGGQTGYCGENLNQLSCSFHKHPAELVRQSLHVLYHLTRLVTCTVLVAGFFAILFLYDLAAFFALYTFSVCWWFYTWRRKQSQATAGKDQGARGGAAEDPGA